MLYIISFHLLKQMEVVYIQVECKIKQNMHQPTCTHSQFDYIYQRWQFDKFHGNYLYQVISVEHKFFSKLMGDPIVFFSSSFIVTIKTNVEGSRPNPPLKGPIPPV